MVKASECPLCCLSLEEEKVFYEDDLFRVLRTRKLKGHRERVMIMLKKHEDPVSPGTFARALEILTETGKKLFCYTPKFVIMDSTFASVRGHWHLVATDLDPKSEDFDQILATKWIKVVDTAEKS